MLGSSGWWCSQARWAWNVAGVRCGCTLRLRLLPGFGCLVCGSLISDVRLTCSTRKVQGSRQKVAQVFGRHVACNPAAFCWLAVPVARGQPVVANAVTAPLSCEGWLACSAFLWQCQLMPSAPAGALSILQSLPSSGYGEAIACLALQVLRASHFTKTCGHWQVVGVSTRVLTRSPVALCTVGGSLG